MQTLGIVCASLLCFPLHPGPAPGENKERSQISIEELKREIEKKYPKQTFPTTGTGLHFDPKAKIELLKSPVLRRYLPKTRFYLTSVMTDYIEAQKVETVFSATVSDGTITLQECFDLGFTSLPKEFAGQFVGLKPKIMEDRKTLSLAIGELLAKPTGQLKNGHFEKSDYWIEFWTGEVIWRYIVIKFDAKGALRHIEELNPSDVKKSDNDR